MSLMEGSREYLICETRAGDKEGVNEMDRQHWVASVQSVHQRDRMRTSRVSRGVQMEAEHIDRAMETRLRIVGVWPASLSACTAG